MVLIVSYYTFTSTNIEKNWMKRVLGEYIMHYVPLGDSDNLYPFLQSS